MYSNEKKNGFSILDILVKIIFAGLFIFILVWLFQKKVPNMTPFYSNVFRENIKYMQEAGESYFTDNRMPVEIGKEVKITLFDMYEKKLILPFVDEEGNSCNQYNSYVSITKEESGYSLKTNLVCNNESDYTIKILGCHNYCEGNNCGKTCSISKTTKYQFKKLISGTSTKYKCASGYKLNGKYCYKTVLTDSKSAETKTTTNKTDVQNADIIITDGIKVYVEPIKKTTPASTVTRQEAYSCTKDKTEKKCTTSNVSEPYSCNCTSYVDATYKTVFKCNTCYKTVPVETCNDVKSTYTDTCYRTITDVIPASTTYTCPSGVDGSEGTGANLKCFKATEGSIKYECKDKSYTPVGNKCIKNITDVKNELSCANFSGYKLEGKTCNKYTTTKIKATVKKSSTKYYTYKWSTKETLSGWSKTGKTKTVKGEEVCE